MSEVDEIIRRYERRSVLGLELDSPRYQLINPSVYMAYLEKMRALIHWLNIAHMVPYQTRLLEIGCGNGNDLLFFLQLGFLPHMLVGNELLEQRAALSRQRLPQDTDILCGDASEFPLDKGQFDVVYQSMIFTSILDGAFQEKLAARMWELTRPGGGVLWYDFIYNNPANPDVQCVSPVRLKALFPEGHFTTWRVTLAPPVSRAVTRVHPGLYSVFNALPCLRTHMLCWIAKPE